MDSVRRNWKPPRNWELPRNWEPYRYSWLRYAASFRLLAPWLALRAQGLRQLQLGDPDPCAAPQRRLRIFPRKHQDELTVDGFVSSNSTDCKLSHRCAHSIGVRDCDGFTKMSSTLTHRTTLLRAPAGHRASNCAPHDLFWAGKYDMVAAQIWSSVIWVAFVQEVGLYSGHNFPEAIVCMMAPI